MDSLDAMLGGIDAGEAQAEEREAREAPEPTPDVIASLEAQLPVEATVAALFADNWSFCVFEAWSFGLFFFNVKSSFRADHSCMMKDLE